MSEARYTCESQQRLIKVLLALAGHEVDGASLTELTSALASRTGKAQKNSIFRDLQNMKQAGIAEQLPDSDRWRLAPRIVQIATSYERYITRATTRLDETRQRYGREL